MRSFESREDYLETILVLYQEKGAVRSIDVAERMKFSKPSVSRAVGLLKSAGLVTMDREGFLRLTCLLYTSSIWLRWNRRTRRSFPEDRPGRMACRESVQALFRIFWIHRFIMK